MGDATFHGFRRQGSHGLGVTEVIAHFLMDRLGKRPVCLHEGIKGRRRHLKNLRILQGHHGHGVRAFIQ